MRPVGDEVEAAVREVEHHRSASGWDQRPVLYALVPTADVVWHEPALAAQLGLDTGPAGALTAVEQEDLPSDAPIDDVLAGMAWPDEVVGAALAIETVALPDGVEDETPGADAGAWAALHPDRQEARLVVGVLRDGRRAAALRWRSHDNDVDVVTGPDLAPALADALAASLR